MNERDEAKRKEDLAATSDSLREDARRVMKIEEEKQDLEPGDSRLTSLSNEAEHIAGNVQAKSRIERDLAERSEDRGSEDQAN